MPKQLDKPSKAQLDERGWVASYNCEQFSYCCGGKEIGDLQQYERPRYVNDMWTKNTYRENEVYKTVTEAWKAKIPQMRQGSFGYPLMINVVEDKTPELAELLRKESDCTEVLKWSNPNTGNIITMFILTNGSDETPKEKDEDEDDDY